MLPPWRFVVSRWPWAGLAYGFTSALAGAVVLVSIIPTILLVPIWAIWLAAVDRRRLRLLGLPLLASGHVHVPSEERHNWLGIRLTEPATWREVASLLTNTLLGAVWVALLFLQGLFLAAVIAMPVIVRQGHTTVHLFGDLHVVLGPSDWWKPLLLALAALPLFGYINAACAALHGGATRWIIAPRVAEIDGRVTQLTRSRTAMVDAHADERRRIERDLHDGVQQELVAIAARLGILELELAGGDQIATRAALEATQTQTERALQALRETVRGIHPAVLSDRGLAAALEDLAGRSALPLRVDDLGFPRLSPAAEAAAYFFVAEAVTNAAKHTAAPRVVVTLSSAAETATVVARDAGHGGVDLARGTGLLGLSERADALGGSLTVSSPPGGPTLLTLSLPLPGGGAGVGAVVAAGAVVTAGAGAGDPAGEALPSVAGEDPPREHDGRGHRAHSAR